ncbi:hypothetical protein F-S17_0027 [Faustovirus]|nr:hypothetical protein F-S17_0027 [Faustovirus]
MQAKGNDYTCVAYTGDKHNKSQCVMAAKYKLPNVSIPTHCEKHQKQLAGAIKDPETPHCRAIECHELYPRYGPRGSLPVLCGSCCQTATDRGLCDYVDTTRQCRFLHCQHLATHGICGLDMVPWICPGHAKRMKFACSVIYKLKCLHCDNHAAYATIGLSEYTNGAIDYRIPACRDHIAGLINSVNLKFEAMVYCQSYYCEAPVESSMEFNERVGAHLQQHGLCSMHLHLQDSIADKCEYNVGKDKCNADATHHLEGKKLCLQHLNKSTIGTIIARTDDPVYTSTEILTKIGKLPREMNLAQQQSFIHSLMQAASPTSGRSAGIGATRKRTVSQRDSTTPQPQLQSQSQLQLQSQPISVPATPAHSDPVSPISQASVAHSPQSHVEICFPDTIIMEDHNGPYIPQDEFIPHKDHISGVSYDSTYAEALNYPVINDTPYDSIIKHVIEEYQFMWSYDHINKCYHVNSPTPIFILTDTTTQLDRVSSCIVVRIQHADLITYETIKALFHSFYLTMTAPFAPKYCEYEI